MIPAALSWLACAHDPAGRDPVADLRATLRDGAIEVSLHLPLGWIPGERGGVVAEFGELPFRDGQQGFDDFLERVGEDGATSPWPDVLPIDGDTLDVRYRARLTHHLAGPARGLDEVPHPTVSGWMLTGRAFVPVGLRLADGRRLEVPARLRWEVPEGDVVLASTPFEVPSLVELADAMYAVGSPLTTRVEVGGATVTVVTSDFDDAELAVAAELVRRAMALDAAWLGDPGPGERWVAFDRHASGGIDGMVLGRAVAVLSGRPPRPEAGFDAGVVAVHELAHLWNRAPEWWLNEGFTRYLELLSRVRLDGLSEEQALVELAPILERYLEEAGQRSVAESSGSWGYAAGAVVALCADVDLRSRLGDPDAFFAAHRDARAHHPGGERTTLDADGWFAAVRKRSPEAADRAEELVSRAGPIDLSACLAPAGYAVEVTPIPKLPRAHFDGEVLGVAARSGYTTEVFAAGPGGGFEADDRVLTANGTPLSRFADLELVLRDVAPGEPLVFGVRRGQSEVTVDRVRPALPEGVTDGFHVRVTRAGPGDSPFVVQGY